MTIIKNSFFNNLAGAWIFYTTFPRLPFVTPQFQNIIQFAPLIGILIGLFQSCIYIILRNYSWPVIGCICLTISSGYLITGGLHNDGLMDTFDGIYAGKKKMLKAIKDSRVGSFGVQILLLINIVQIASLAKIDTKIIYAIPICLFWGRFSTLIYVEKFKYLSHKKKTISHKKYWRGFKQESALSLFLLIFIIIFYISSNITNNSPFKVLLLIFSGVFFAFKVPMLLGNKIGGFNGDSCGASSVIVETLMLFTSAILL